MAKKAVGYEADEVVEEYAKDDEGLTLIKKKITKKHYPPDTQAAKMIIDSFYREDYKNYTTEELYAMLDQLLKEYKGEGNEKNKT